MLKTKIKLTFALFLSGCISLSSYALDWSNIEANDYGLKVANDEEKLYFQFDEDTSKGENIQLFIDSDNNKNTGYTNESLENEGADFVIIGSSIYRSLENGDTWAFQKIPDAQNGLTYKKNGIKTEIELEKSVLSNLKKDIKIGILHCIQSSKVIPFTQLLSQPQIPNKPLEDSIVLNYKFDSCTINGAKSVNGKINQAAEFNGIDNFINIGSLNTNFSNGFSFAGWVNFEREAGDKLWETIFTTDTPPTRDSNPNAHSNGIWLIRYKNENKLYFTFRNDGKHCADVYTKNNVLTPGTFQHIVATIDINNFPHIYINGKEVQLVKHVVTEGGECSIPNIKRDFTYLAHPNDRFSNNNYFKGKLDEIKIFDKTLTQNDINNIYHNESIQRDLNATPRATIDCSQNSQQTPDTIPPVIELIGDSIITIPQGGVYNEPGVTARDNIDGNLTNATVSGSVNTNQIGTYILTYSVKDSSNNVSTVKRTVNVVKKMDTQTPNPLPEYENNIQIDAKTDDWKNIPSLVDNAEFKVFIDDNYLYLLLNTNKESGTTLFYINSDANDATGRRIWNRGRGIDYKLANNRLYKYENRKFRRVRNTSNSIQYKKRGSVIEVKIKKSLLQNINKSIEISAVRYNKRTWKKSVSFPNSGSIRIDY